jgi:hypothetical protein
MAINCERQLNYYKTLNFGPFKGQLFPVIQC